jgi:3-oxoacyl-[acyl-carrier protein] reductase
MSKFSGISAAITGGEDGIYLGLARALGKRGARVPLLDVRTDAPSETAGIFKAEGSEAIAISCDVTDKASIEAAATTVKQTFSGLNLVWGNAGVGMMEHRSALP